ncbi:MAG: hypothetical protein ACPGNV_12130 [Mangrovicoccus sp.]
MKFSEIAKRPLEITLCGIVIFIILFLGRHFGIIPERFVGYGVDFDYSQETARRVDSQNNEIAQLRAELDKLKSDIALWTDKISVQTAHYGEATGTGGVPQGERDSIFEADINELPEDINESAEKPLVPPSENVTGVIWLGYIDPSGIWKRATIELSNGSTLGNPKELNDLSFTVTSRPNVRSGYPSDNSSIYYRDNPVILTSEKGWMGRILEPPRTYSRENGTHYWAKVDLTLP